MPMLDVRDIHSFYGNIHALQGISLTVEEGEIVTLIGANGAGKSTTLNTICGLVRPREGQIWLRGEPLHTLKAHEIVAHGVAQVPEGRKIFGRMTVIENLEMGAFVRKDKAGIQEDVERVFALFPRLQERRRQLGGTLSGGEQQMLAMGRGMMARPHILLVEQNALMALSIASRGYVLQVGRIVLQDTAASLQQNEMVRKAYLGEE